MKVKTETRVTHTVTLDHQDILAMCRSEASRLLKLGPDHPPVDSEVQVERVQWPDGPATWQATVVVTFDPDQKRVL
jgi:hypothetical protein